MLRVVIDGLGCDVITCKGVNRLYLYISMQLYLYFRLYFLYIPSCISPSVPIISPALNCANFELTNHIAYRVENKSPISTAGKLIFQVREYT